MKRDAYAVASLCAQQILHQSKQVVSEWDEEKAPRGRAREHFFDGARLTLDPLPFSTSDSLFSAAT